MAAPVSTNVTLTSAKNPKLVANCKMAACVQKKVIIIIDPGHGYTKGSTGSASRIYTYKIQGENKKPILDHLGNPKEESKGILDLPEYVRNDPKTWIVKSKEDHSKPERALVYKVSEKLKSKVELAAEVKSVFLTRGKGPITGNDDSKTRQKRVDIAHNNKADYFISIHADGVNSYTKSGAHVIYGTNSSESLELAKDIKKNYSVVSMESPKKNERNLQVINTKNKTKRKILIELGFITSPKDAYAMYTNIDKMVEQIYSGIIENIKINF